MQKTRLIHGDCLTALKRLPAGSVDAVVTDPPYGISQKSNRGASWAGTEIEGDSDTALRDWIVAWAQERRLPWATFGTWKRPHPTQTRATLVWDKGPASGMGDLSLPWKQSWEQIHIGGPGWKGHRDEGVLKGNRVVTWETKGRSHPNQKPASLLVEIVTKLPPGATVLDPFMGSGTTGVACLETGRNFIGIEKDPEYFAVARSRIAAARRALLIPA